MEACKAAKLGGGVHITTESGRTQFLGQTTKAFSGWIMHGTSVQSALNIIRDGYIKESEGIAGIGVYGFEIADGESTEVLERQSHII